MFDIVDLRTIRAVSAASSLAAAARSLDVTPPAVSQRLAHLESRLGLKLVDRGQGILRLTAEGELMAARAEAILKDLQNLEGDLAERRGAIAGPLRVVAPFGYGRLHVAPSIASFVIEHDEVVPTLFLTDDPRGAMRAGPWDLLIHVGRLPDLGVIQRKLASNRRLLCASPLYLERYGTPSSPDELRNHRCGVIREDQADVTLWNLTSDSGERQSVRIDPAFDSNDGEVVRGWAVDGLGIVERSGWSVEEDLKAGRLVEVLADWRLPDADVVALLNPRSVRASRTEAFLKHLASNQARAT